MPFFRLKCNEKIILNREKAFRPPKNPFGPKIVPNNERKNYYKILGQPRFELGPPAWKASVSPTRPYWIRTEIHLDWQSYIFC